MPKFKDIVENAAKYKKCFLRGWVKNEFVYGITSNSFLFNINILLYILYTPLL